MVIQTGVRWTLRNVLNTTEKDLELNPRLLDLTRMKPDGGTPDSYDATNEGRETGRERWGKERIK